EGDDRCLFQVCLKEVPVEDLDSRIKALTRYLGRRGLEQVLTYFITEGCLRPKILHGGCETSAVSRPEVDKHIIFSNLSALHHFPYNVLWRRNQWDPTQRYLLHLWAGPH